MPRRMPQELREHRDRYHKSRSSFYRHMRRVAGLKECGTYVSDLHGTSLQAGREMDALIALPIEERARLIGAARAGEQVSAVERKKDLPITQRDLGHGVNQLVKAFNRARPEVRQHFVERLLEWLEGSQSTDCADA